MAEHKKLSMLVKLDDGQTYTLGGDSADNAVTLDTEQTITAVKTFDKLPQSSAKPANDHDLVNKVYVDALKPKLKTTVILNVESESTSWAAFNSIKFSTTTGKFIEPVYLEDTVTSTAVEPLKFVFKLADSFTGNATAKNKDFFKDYQLQEGEYFGSFTPSHLLEARWSTHTSNQQANPFSNYLAYLTTGPNSVLPFLEYQFDGLSDELKQVAFTIGDIYNSNGYPPVKFQFVVSTGAKEFTSKVYTKDADGIGRGSSHTVEFKLKALEYVTLDTKQEITGAKTFTQNVTVTAKPKAATDVATVGYVSGLLNAKAPYDVTLDFKVEDDTDGGWVVYSNMEINLDNGKKLKCIHIDNTQPTSANAPVKAVFKAIPATEAINAAPAEQAPTFFDTYQLQDEEYLGTLTYGHILNSQLQDYASYTGPFHTNQYGTTCTIKEATQLRITLSELPAAVSKVSLKFDSSYLPKTFKASLSGVGMDVTSNVLTNPSGNTPLELLFDIVKLTGLVTLDTAQTITGAKTFEVLPKSEATPKDDADLITKAYLDERCPIPKSELTLKGSLMQYSYHPDRWIVYQDLRFTLANGQHLVPLYIEDTTVDQIKGPIKVVYKFSDAEYVKNAVEKKTKDFLENYQLTDNELLGQIYHASLLDENAGPHYVNDYVKPFDEIYVGINASDFNLRPLIKFSFEKLSTPLAQVKLSCSGSYAPKQFQLEWDHENKKFVSKLYTFGQDEFLGTAPLEVQIVSAGTGGAAPANMVTTDTAQNITEVKTFDKLPKSSVEPTDDTELVNKKYVDAAAKSLQGYEITLYGTPKATGLIGFKNLRFYFANGLRLYPRLVDDTAANTANEAKRFIWTLVNTSSYEDVQAQAKLKAELDKYVLTSSEYDGLITYPQTCGKFTLTRDQWFAIGGYVRVQGQASNGEQPIVKLRVLGSLAPITKMELTIDSEANYIAESFRAEVSKIGDTPKTSNTVNPTAVNELVTFNIEETFKPDPLYVNRFDDQDVFGSKAFKSVPKIDKAPAAYGLADANESTAFGDLYGSAAIAKPVSQNVNFDIGTTQERKAPNGGSVWQSKYTCKVQIYNFAPKIRRPDTYEEAQLYLKAVGPSSEGYRGILSLEKPSNYPQLSSIQVMDRDTMNGYKLQVNEYFCKLQYLTGSGRKSRTEEALNNALKSGSDKIKQLFSSDASEWWTATSSWHQDHASAHNPDDIPWAVVNLFIYNAPVLCAVPASNSSSYTSRRNDTLNVTSAAYYANVSTSLDLPAVNWAQKVRDVQMCSVDVLAAIRALQKTNTALEARIKALEDAAPKPQYKLIVVIL